MIRAPRSLIGYAGTASVLFAAMFFTVIAETARRRRPGRELHSTPHHRRSSLIQAPAVWHWRLAGTSRLWHTALTSYYDHSRAIERQAREGAQ
jgi:hypothetical protein